MSAHAPGELGRQRAPLAVLAHGLHTLSHEGGLLVHSSEEAGDVAEDVPADRRRSEGDRSRKPSEAVGSHRRLSAAIGRRSEGDQKPQKAIGSNEEQPKGHQEQSRGNRMAVEWQSNGSRKAHAKTTPATSIAPIENARSRSLAGVMSP